MSQEKTLARIAGRTIGVLAALALISTCIYLLVKGRPDVASYPAVCAGVLGYFILRPGKRSVTLNLGGGVVVGIMSDDTGVIRTGVNAVVTQMGKKPTPPRTPVDAR